KILIFVSWSSSIAASFLIGMFLFEIFSPPKNKEFASTKITPVNITPALDENAIIKNPMTLRDFKKIVSMKQEQRAFYSSLVNKNKLLYK
ncbi:MAG: hypothetical protein FWD60_13755, partial [Candidatus Azobacteroides sp.]|nr:hypothetical protein [Candidatus Azobacteroides sp.]